MEYAYSFMMLAFGIMLLLYAALLGITKDYQLITRNWATKVRNKKMYATQFAKLIAVIALGPIVSAGIWFIAPTTLYVQIIAIAVLVISIVVDVKVGGRLMRPFIS